MGKRKTSRSEVSTGKCQRKPHLRLVLILSHSPDAGEQVFRRKKRVVPLIFPKHTENWVLSLWETRGGTQLPPPSYITTTFSKLSHSCSSRTSPEPGSSRLYQLHPAGMWGKITLSDRKGEIKISLFSAVLRVTAQLTAALNNALGANKILRNPFLDCSESFIFISSYQHASKAHIN